MPREIQYILKIKWDRVNETTYTRDDIITLGNLSIEESNIVGFAGGLSVTLDDSSGVLYALFRATDFHKVPASLYKLEESVESLVFAGEVTSPITWSENSREVNLTIDTKIEDREVGFSLEESIVGCAKESIGQPWPLCFGNVLHVPATRIVETRTGVLMERFGFIDPLLAPSITATLNAYYQELYIMRFSQQQLEVIGNLAPDVLTILDTYIGAIARRKLLHEARDLKVAIGKGEINRADLAGAGARIDEILELVFGDDPAEVIDELLAAIHGIDPALEMGALMRARLGDDWIIDWALALMALFFEWFNRFMEYMQQLVALYQETLQNMSDAINNARQLHAQYIVLHNEYCRQLEFVKDCVHVNCGTSFPQKEETDIIIDNIKWRGEFDGEEFCFNPNTPLSLYEDLAVAEWTNQPDACGYQNNYTNLNKFYLEDDSYNLTGLYCLVKTAVQHAERRYRVFKITNVGEDTVTIDQNINADIDSPYTISGSMVEGTSATAVGTTVVFGDSPNLAPVSVDGTSVIYLLVDDNWRAFEINGKGTNLVSIRGSINISTPVDYKISDTPIQGSISAYTDGESSVISFRDTVDLSSVVPGMLIGLFVRVSDARHIIKISEQEENEVTFELIGRPTEDTGGTGVRLDKGQRTSRPILPFYGVGGGALPWEAPVLIAEPHVNEGQLGEAVIAALLGSGVNWVTPDEYKDLLAIQEMLRQRKLLSTPIIWSAPTAREMYYVIGEDILEVLKVASQPLPDWFDPVYPIPQAEVPDDLGWIADYGATVYDATALHEVYVANLLPSEIKSIMAYRDTEEEDVLMPVPSRFYSYCENENVGPFNVTAIRFPRPLKMIDPKWKDTLHVSLNSSVGPNVIDVLEYLIDTFTEYAYDVTSFNACKALATNYPVNFALLDRKNVLDQLQEIAWQSRHRLLLVNDVFYIKYLSTEPSSVGTLDESNTLAETELVTLNSTDDLVTKMVITYKEDYLGEDNKFILRHNVNKYGLQEQSYDWYIYTDKDLVVKSATYWLIQYANMWNHLQAQTVPNSWTVGDCVTVNIGIAASTKAIIIRQEFDLNNKTTTHTLWLPIRNGEEDSYIFAWPADAEETDIFPQPEDDAGSPGPGRNLDTLPTGLPCEG